MTTAFRNGIRKVAAHLAPDTLGDGELLSRFLNDGDETAFGVLVRRHAAMVFGTCRRVLGNATDADDAFQATFVVLVRKATAFTDRKCIGNFLYGVAYRTALKAREMAVRRRKREAEAIPPEPMADDSELLKMLDEELAKLPDKYREPVVLCELEGKSRREVSERLGIPEGTISSRLAAAHRLLEKRLAARGFAVVSVASILPNSALAVSVELAEVAVLTSISQPSASVSLLVTEVMKMMFLSKLKTGAAIVLGTMLLLGSGAVLIPGGGQAQGEEKTGEKSKAPTPALARQLAEQDEAKLLLGTWVSKKVSTHPANPNFIATDDYIWTFDHDSLQAVTNLAGQEYSSTNSRYVLNPHVKPKQLNIVGDRKLLLCLYEVNGEALKIAYYARSEVDRPRSFDRKDMPKDADALTVIEFERRAKKPTAPPVTVVAKKATAKELYRLADGELLKLIPGPYPDDRLDVLRTFDIGTGISSGYGFHVISTDGNKTRQFRSRRSYDGGDKIGEIRIDESTTLEQLTRTLLQLTEQELHGLDYLDGMMPKRMHLDALFRENTPIEKLVPAFQNELKSKFNIDLRFHYTDEERDVVRLTGKHKLIDPKQNRIDLYATKKLEQAPANRGSSSSQSTADYLSLFIHYPVIDESDLKTREVPISVYFHKRWPPIAQTTAEDCDPEKVLKNFADQTGVTYEFVKRKVRRLDVEKPVAATPMKDKK